MFHVECVRRGVSPLVMVTVVIGVRRRGSVRDDSAVGTMRVRRRRGDIIE